jgi:alpha-tubulin suppressor-like RCC1 family protein
VQCWGANESGQLGNGTMISSLLPVPVTGITSAVSVSAGRSESCAALGNGIVQCWGHGALGNGTTWDSSVPIPVSNITDAVNVAVGESHVCAVLQSGTVQCWGNSAAGELGDGTGNGLGSSAPVMVLNITDAVNVGVGAQHSCALLRSGAVQCWGSDYSGELGSDLGTTSSVPVAVSGITNAVGIAANGRHSCALLSSGEVKCWGSSCDGSTPLCFSPVTIPNITNAVKVTAGYDYSCAALAQFNAGVRTPRGNSVSQARQTVLHQC